MAKALSFDFDGPGDGVDQDWPTQAPPAPVVARVPVIRPPRPHGPAWVFPAHNKKTHRLIPGPVMSFMGDYRFLSNFADSDVVLDGVTYPTVEHAYQAAKTTDPVVREQIRRAWLPGIAKKLGQKVDVDPSWWRRRRELVRGLLVQKFATDPLKSKLAATAPHVLVEGNWWGDIYWGVCRDQGENWLGRILMSIRDGVPVEEVVWQQTSAK